MNKIKSISLIIPVYRDSNTIKLMIKKSLKVLKKINKKFEIIIIDDCCPQKSGEIALSIYKKIKQVKVFFHNKNRGYGAALKTGLKKCKNDWIFMVDGDNEYDVNDIYKLMKESQNHDLIVTYRYKKKYNLYRKIVSWSYNLILRSAFKINFKDISSGSRLLSRKLTNKIKINTNGPFFGAELAIKSKYNNFKIKEVGINTTIRKFGEGSIVNISNIILTIKEIIILFIKIHLKNKNIIKNIN
jgi:glycosyltransferase involved in cell wall biosynthesis